MKAFPDFKKYRWFFTSSNKLIVGGKSSTQNDELLKWLQKTREDFIVMHTTSPGSPFSVIFSDMKTVSAQDLEETAIFTGCFSREWRSNKKIASIDIFRLSQLSKSSGMKPGQWGVLGKSKRVKVNLKLSLTVQKNILRAVPDMASKQTILRVIPGKVDKTQMVTKIQEAIGKDFSKESILSALPAGGVSINEI